jgi:hypothetical protein
VQEFLLDHGRAPSVVRELLAPTSQHQDDQFLVPFAASQGEVQQTVQQLLVDFDT